MPPTISVRHQLGEAVFAFSPVDRHALYGRRRRLALDEQGSLCSRASLLDDGSLLLTSGMTAQGYFLPDGVWVPQGELEAVLEDGTAATLVPSTLGVPQELVEITPEMVLDLHIQTTYLLQPEALGDQLNQALESGRLFTFPFNYRTDYSCETGVLLANDEGIWALIGVPVTPQWQELTTMTSIAIADVEEDDDDLDFEMF